MFSSNQKFLHAKLTGVADVDVLEVAVAVDVTADTAAVVAAACTAAAFLASSSSPFLLASSKECFETRINLKGFSKWELLTTVNNLLKCILDSFSKSGH